jgi:hypothetical protein
LLLKLRKARSNDEQLQQQPLVIALTVLSKIPSVLFILYCGFLWYLAKIKTFGILSYLA